MQNHFYKHMEYVGADKKSIDPTRVFRVAGSVNSKNDKEVVVLYRHDYRYVLRDLQSEYLDQQKEKTEDKLWQLKEAMQRHSKGSNVKIAEVLAVSEGYVRKLRKHLEL